MNCYMHEDDAFFHLNENYTNDFISDSIIAFFTLMIGVFMGFTVISFINSFDYVSTSTVSIGDRLHLYFIAPNEYKNDENFDYEKPDYWVVTHNKKEAVKIACERFEMTEESIHVDEVHCCCCKKYYTEDEGNSSDDEDKEDVPYETKYTELYEEMIQTHNKDKYQPFTSDKLKDLIRKTVMEHTPNGNVILSYKHDETDKDLSRFIYYSDDRSIPFKYLDTVARKYAIEYECPEVYLYLKSEFEREVEKIKEEEEKQKLAEANEESKQTEQTKNNVFASFKKYKQPNKSTKTNKKKYILVGKNRYTRLGTIQEYYDSLNKKEEAEPVKISFSEYKKLNLK